MTPSGLRTALVILALLAPVAALAQYPRLVLVEEGTNASCEPCAWQNPIFETFLEKSDVAPVVVPIVYHAYWPGRDTMNLRAPEMHDARIRGAYGMLGMPSVVINGQQYPSATPGLGASNPADTAGIRRRIDSLRVLTSPILISIDDTIVGDRLIARTSVVSDVALDATLRIAVVERHHRYVDPPAGNNGEIDFPWIVRAMLPAAAGRPLVLDAGGELVVDDTVAIDPEWERSELYVVAFVQVDSSRDVLQAASTREHATIAMSARPAQRMRGDSTTIAAWSMDMHVTRWGEYVIGYESEMPPGWELDVRVSLYPVDSGHVAVLSPIGPSDLDIAMTPDPASPGRGVARVWIRGDRGAVDTIEVRLYSGDIGIPVFTWHERRRPEVPAAYADALERTPHRFTIVPREDDDLFTLAEHPLVVVAAGDDTLDAGQRARLRDYLDARGRLLISGSQIAQSLGDPEYDQTGIPRDTAFLHGYLHATYVAPTSATLAVNGVRNDPIGRDVGFSLGGPRAPGTPDRIRPRRNALPAFYYGSSRDSIAAIRYGRPEHRLVYLAFGAEAIADTTLRATVLGRSIDWLLGDEITTGIEEAVAELDVMLAPNPARGTVWVALDAAHDARVTIHSALGERIADRTVARGTRRLELDVSGLSAGVYLVTIESEGARVTERLVVERP